MVRLVAVLMIVSGVLIAHGGAMEFRYFGPGTPQFSAGLAATPSGIAAALVESSSGGVAPPGASWSRAASRCSSGPSWARYCE